MSGRTYRMVEIVGTSPEGVDAAITNGIKRANRTVRHIDWFQVTEIRGHLQNGEVADWQVSMKIGFRLEDTQT
jgi:dodecin